MYHSTEYIVRKSSKITDCSNCAGKFFFFVLESVTRKFVTLMNNCTPKVSAAFGQKLKDYRVIGACSFNILFKWCFYHILLQIGRTIAM